jgi:hypothetical protein
MSFKLRHSAIHLIYFAAVITASAVFSHPCFLPCAYLCAFLCNLFVNGKRGFERNLRFLLLTFLFMLFYSGYNHSGVTNLSVNLIGNKITFFILITALLAAHILGETSAVYSSVIIISVPTLRKMLFTLIYAGLLLLPIETETAKKCFTDSYR